MTVTEWAVEAFALLQKEWATHADWEASRKIPASAKTKRLEAFLLTAPPSVKREVLKRKGR